MKSLELENWLHWQKISLVQFSNHVFFYFVFLLFLLSYLRSYIFERKGNIFSGWWRNTNSGQTYENTETNPAFIWKSNKKFQVGAKGQKGLCANDWRRQYLPKAVETVHKTKKTFFTRAKLNKAWRGGKWGNQHSQSGRGGGRTRLLGGIGRLRFFNSFAFICDSECILPWENILNYNVTRL